MRKDGFQELGKSPSSFAGLEAGAPLLLKIIISSRDPQRELAVGVAERWLEGVSGERAA